MNAGETLNMSRIDERVEDVLTLYTAGVMSRMDECYRKSLSWSHAAERAAYQMGREEGDSCNVVNFGVPVLDRAFRKGQHSKLTFRIVSSTEQPAENSAVSPQAQVLAEV